MSQSTYQLFSNGSFVGTFEGGTEEIAHVVAGASPTECYIITDSSDTMVLRTVGSFLNRVPDQKWLKEELHPLLVPIQSNEVERKEIPIH